VYRVFYLVTIPVRYQFTRYKQNLQAGDPDPVLYNTAQLGTHFGFNLLATHLCHHPKIAPNAVNQHDNLKIGIVGLELG
jgi:hypothetical protein